jgi:diguanylate cyclase (GGDEF)-like protein/PAS domain S-box-containing protein
MNTALKSRLRGVGAPVPAADEALPPPAATRRARWSISPRLLAYMMGPAAFVTIMLLRRYGLIAQESAWLWLGIFIAIPLLSVAADELYDRHPSALTLHARVAWHAAAVTIVIYLTGWGPVMVGAFAFVALENLSRYGSRSWKVTALWSLVGIGAGQAAIWGGLAPSFLSVSKAQTLGVMGIFVLLFVIRMAGATMAQKEDAESSLRESEERFRSLVQNSSDTTLVIGLERKIAYASPASHALLGLAPEDVVGKVSTDFVHPDDRERVEVQLAARLQEQRVTDPIQFRMRHANGGWRHVEAVVKDLRDRRAVNGYVANVRDITERKEAEALLAHQALHDPLTGLPNRTLILDRAEQMLARSRREHQPVAALFIDLDNFKDINDTLGHEVGDKILQAVADRFSRVLRANDTVGRLGGDEFVVLAEGVSLAAGPELVAERLNDVLREPFRIRGYEGAPLTISASIGIAAGDRPSAQELLREADIALYRAKAAGKNCWALFVPEMESEVLDRLELQMDLRSALANGEFFLLYQPVFELDSLNACGVEALLRWMHPTRGVVGPDQFIPMLEETGMIVEVGRWVLDTASDQVAAWHRLGHHLNVSVNVSVRQLESESFFDHVRHALSASGLDPSSLVLEITETAIMRDSEATVRRLRDLKGLGVLLAIDDFGTGYSSLAYLRRFPFDALKIDRSFISSMAESAESSALIHTLVELGRALGLETLAEGIEERSQLERLRREDCERGQGFLFSRPVEPQAIEAFLSLSEVADTPS